MHDQYQAKLAQCGTSAGLSPQQLTLKERLESQKFHVEQQLQNINAALAALEKFPGVEECINALGKVGGLY